jgi:predicted dehydrogenase
MASKMNTLGRSNSRDDALGGKHRRLAIVGLGTAAKNIHLPAYKKLKNLEVVAGCDPAVRSDRYHFPMFSDAQKMLREVRPDILSVVTPPVTHFELVSMGLEAGCHVFCEKPFVESMDQARQISTLADRVDRHVVVNNQYRFMDIYSTASKFIGDPCFGELLFLNAEQTFFVTEKTEAGWRGQDTQRVCKEFGIHVIDLCRFFFKEDPIRVLARMPKPQNTRADLLNLIRLDFSGDRVAQITLDRLCRGRHRYLDLRLDGTEASIETRLGGGITLATGIRGGSRRPFFTFDISLSGKSLLCEGEKCRRIGSGPLNIFATATAVLLSQFMDALDKGIIPPCNGNDNARTLAVMLAAYESDAKCGPVEITYDA